MRLSRKALASLTGVSLLAIVGLTFGLFAGGMLTADSGDPAAALEGDPAAGLTGEAVVAQEAGSGDPLIFSYPARFVCMEAAQGLSLSNTPALIREQTEVVIHNPNEYPVTYYRKAVRARTEAEAASPPGAWGSVTIDPDHAIRMNCDNVAKLLTGNPAATFIGTYGVGVRVEGLVVVASAPQTVATVQRPGTLDVSVEYARGSEVLKKDINYQPWWSWWWWNLPWQLGHPYQRIINLGNLQEYIIGNRDCRGHVFGELLADAAAMTPGIQKTMTETALLTAQSYDAHNERELTPNASPMLIPLIGDCHVDYSPSTQSTLMSVDYILVSNKGPSDPDPTSGTPPYNVGSQYPWTPGKFSNLNLAVPNNTSLAMSDVLRDWLTQRWLETPNTVAGSATAAMSFFFPWWCGNQYWNSFSPTDCIDIGVGEGESLDVEQVVPQRVIFSSWPPTP